MTRPSFPSKRDAWLTVVLWSAVVACVGGGLVDLASGGLVDLASGGPPLVKALGLVVPLAVAALILWVLYGTSYTFAGPVLDIRSGPFRFQVALGEIDSVVPSRNPLSGPACSLDRLLIRYGHRQILVSPEDRAGFLDALTSRAPQLVRDRDHLLR